MTAARAVAEEFRAIDAFPDRLFAVTTAPRGWAGGTAVLLLPGAGVACTGVARLWVVLARELAAHGHLAMRLDVRGVGESGGRAAPDDPLRPPVADAEAAARELRALGATRVVVVGECFGARTALGCAGRVDALRGVVLLAPLVSAAAADTPGHAAEAADLVDRVGAAAATGVRVAVAYGADDAEREPFASAMRRRFGDCYERTLRGVALYSPATRIHGATSVRARSAIRAVLMDALEWIGDDVV